MDHYLSAIGLELSVKKSLNKFVATSLQESVEHFSEEEINQLYHYSVPEIVPGAGCGLKAQEPYCLEKTLGLEEADLSKHDNTLRLYRLNRIVTHLQELTGVDWLGIYRKTTNLEGETILLKEAYYGRFSRGEFPLNAEFAKGSNNSTVGLSGKAVVVQSVEQYEGPYYTCDVQVQSEFCLPIFDEEGKVIGIIDAEAFQPHFFTNQKLCEIAKVAYDLGKNKALFLSL